MSNIPEPRNGEPIRVYLTKSGEPRYRVILDAQPYANGKRRQVRSVHRTLSDARAHIRKHKSDRDAGKLQTLDRRNGRQTFESFAELWIAGRERTGKIRPNTAVGYRSATRRANEIFGQKAVSEVTDADIESVVASLVSRDVTQRSVEFTLFVVRAVFKEALRQKLVLTNPAEFTEASGRPSKARQALTTAEIATLRNLLSGERLFACWLLTLNGLRRSEVMGLRWSDVDLVNATLSVERGRVSVSGRNVEGRPKTKRGERTLPLPDDVLGALRELRQVQLAAFGAEQVRTGYVAVDEVGEPVRPEHWTDDWNRHCKAAGVRGVTLHAARHSSVTAMRDRGVPDHIVAAWHGHDEVTMRRAYSHAHVDALAAAGRTLAEAYSGR